ncbi:MAG: hypothetical protein KKC18_13910, partial [Chloroflexi bacterium]|nr:hypothetical protein [Chloroflexota bacterium]
MKQAENPQSTACTERSRSIRNPQSGASLVEILVAVAIVASALAILVAALSTGAFAVRTSNRLTTATNLVATQLESIKAEDYVTGTVSYPTIPAPQGYVVTNTVATLAG